MKNARYLIWLQLTVGVGKAIKPIIDYFGSAENLYNSNYLQRKVCPSVTDKMLDVMESTPIEKADEIIAVCKQNGWDIITVDDENYPNKLKEIFDPPAVLYVDGKMPDVDKMLSIAVVGTRKPSNYAKSVARVISKGLARCNAVVISGGALGIDTSAHIGALECGGLTVAVMGCGLGSNYLASNEDLRRRITEKGAVISEFPPFTPASRFTFPMRNRIISGLADGVFVAEAGTKSGSLITANFAVSQNRDMFATAASIFDQRFNGTNKLISDGAVPVVGVESIISHYTEKYKTLDMSKLASIDELLRDEYKKRDLTPEQDEEITFENIEKHRTNRTQIDEKSRQLVGDEKAVFNAMDDDFKDVESIANIAQLDINSVLVALTMLELDGLCESGMGKRYRRKQS